MKLRRSRAASTRSNIGRVNPAASDVDRARELLETAKLQNISDRMLAATQVHATLAVETAVRELIEKLESRSDRSARAACRIDVSSRCSSSAGRHS